MGSEGSIGQKFVDVPFLGQPQPFATGVLSLAKTSGAAVLPVFCFDDDSGRTRLVIEPPIGVASGHDRARALEEGLAQYARVLESYVTRYPAQYRGWHLLGRPGER